MRLMHSLLFVIDCQYIVWDLSIFIAIASKNKRVRFVPGTGSGYMYYDVI